MTFDHLIYLLTVKRAKNTLDEPVEGISKRKPVYADIKYIGYREKTAGRADGLEPEIKFILAERLEYDGEKEIEYNGRRYKVIDVYFDHKTHGAEIKCVELKNRF